ncbi:nucleotide sugar dehydrogenase [Gammaproteobacteria bacterium]|nr:nucleotide sugar dehydrogenase [Gammaproteobacteria bacterium]
MTYSINPLTQETHKVPGSSVDITNIENFLKRNAGKKVIVVQGLGFVGAVMSLVCANALTEEYAVIGVDLANEKTYWKIKSINDGVFPLIADDPKISEFFNKSIDKGNFLATYDPLAYSYADVIIVDINLDVEKESDIDRKLQSFDVSLDGFKSAIQSIGSKCKDNVLILVETTVPPGTCEKIVKPIIENEFIRRGLSLANYHLGHSYERVMPGPEYIDSIREYPRVYSGSNAASADAVEIFLKTIIDTSICDLTRLEHTNATEMAKVLENSYRAMNIAFVVEWSRFAEEAGVDLYSMVNAIRARPTHANLMYPGIGVGGYCLTKDPLLASWARKFHFGASSDLEMSINGVSVNDQMPKFAFNRLVQVFGDVSGKRVAFLGVSYRGDVGDTRFTPVEPLVEMVRETGAKIVLHDPFISYWEEQKCGVESDLNAVLVSNTDIVIISAGHSQYKLESTIDKLMALSPALIYDTIGLFNKEQLLVLQSKHKVSVLGRGDLK